MRKKDRKKKRERKKGKKNTNKKKTKPVIPEGIHLNYCYQTFKVGSKHINKSQPPKNWVVTEHMPDTTLDLKIHTQPS